MKKISKPKGREAIKAWNRQKIIDATIDVITQYGIAGTTIAKVVDLAGVSMGLVNVHFKSKDALLQEVLSQISREYSQHWAASLEDAPTNPGERIRALVKADFDPPVLNLKTMGVWFAFRAQARVNPEYIDLVSTRERKLVDITTSLFEQLNSDGGHAHPPGAVARGLIAMQEGMWTDYFLHSDEFDRGKAIDSIFLFLGALYPENFGPSHAEKP